MSKTVVFKKIVSIIFIVLLIGLLIYLVPLFKELLTEAGRENFKQSIDDLGIFGIILLFALQFAQIFLVVIPGEPIEILAGMCYGAVWGTLFVMISSFLISCFIFFLVRRFGREFVYNFYKKDKVKKILNSKLFKDTKRIEFIILLLFLIPGTPKDLFVYLAALLPIRPYRFIIISTFARFPSIITSTLAGANIVEGNFHTALILYGVIFALVIIIILIVNRYDKSKTTDEIMKTLK